MAESSAELATVVLDAPLPLPSNGGGTPKPATPEELAAKGVAPIKAQFLRPPPPSRTAQSEDAAPAAISESSDGATARTPAPASQSGFVTKDKKSKRQLKRERLQEQKSALHLCPGIAKSGDVSSCQFGDKCRFSHDLEGFKAQKPEDLDGECPFLDEKARCPYGLACRFYNTHKHDVSVGLSVTNKNDSEINGLSKDVQRLLWKNKMKFPKADAKLKALGLLGPGAKKKKDEEEDNQNGGSNHQADENGCNNGVDKKAGDVDGLGETIEDHNVADEVRPLKKAKSEVDEKCCSIEEGSSVPEKKSDETALDSLPEAVSEVLHIEADASLKTHPREKKLVDFSGKLYLAPLTTVGTLPFRRLCKVLGADITCGEMAMCTNLLQGQASEWALLRRHSSEDLFGVQICGAYPDTVARTVELIEQQCKVDFIDINMGCPIDVVVSKGAGSCLLSKPMRMKNVIQASSSSVDTPITVKVRTAYFEGKNRIDSLIADMGNWGASAVTIHGRSRQQRYSKNADWDYISQCARKAPKSLQVLGNGDVFSYKDWDTHKSNCPELVSCMIGRGALVKPWIFTEIKEQRDWDISSGERLDILKDYVKFGLQHWGSDTKGVETTRHFLLEWLSYTCRYIPLGLLEIVPQHLNWRPPSYCGRDDLETLMASESAADWIRISEMLLGKVPNGFTFAPKHKSNAYDRAENG
ncbi:tRNA-dihydrouridine(47) synthase [NAD(P)(+)]-like [Linum grandiflorum]